MGWSDFISSTPDNGVGRYFCWLLRYYSLDFNPDKSLAAGLSSFYLSMNHLETNNHDLHHCETFYYVISVNTHKVK